MRPALIRIGLAACTLMVLAFASITVWVTEDAALAGSSGPTLIARSTGVGPLHLGDTAGSLQRRHLIRRLHPGCELDPGQRVARLRFPLNGIAVFSHPNTKLSSLQILGGAETAKHIGIGSTPGEAQKAYPRAHYQPPGSVPPFAEGFISVNKVSNPRMTFIVDPKTKLISEISVHSPNFCE